MHAVMSERQASLLSIWQSKKEKLLEDHKVIESCVDAQVEDCPQLRESLLLLAN